VVGFGKKIVRATQSVSPLRFALLAGVVVLLIVIRHYYNYCRSYHSYSSYIVHYDTVNNEILAEKYCDDKWCGVRISIHAPKASSAWVPVLVYGEAFPDVKTTSESWLKYIEPHFTWLNSSDLEISISQVVQVLYKKDDVGGRKIICHIVRFACSEMSNQGLLYPFRGAYWKYIGPDRKCMSVIDRMICAQIDIHSGVDKAKVWEWLHEQGVTDEDIWRIGL
jgi:hypothetical protein